MDFGDFTKLILRRWLIAGPLLLLTLVASVGVLVLVKPGYVLTSYVQLVPSTWNTAVAGGSAHANPWNTLGVNSLSQAAMYATEDQTFLQTLPSHGASSNVVIVVGYPNPVITFTVVGDSAAQAKKTTDLVVSRYQEQTEQLQTQFNVNNVDMITTQRLEQGQNLTTSNGKRYRDAVLIFAAGILLTLGLTIGIDAKSRRKLQREGDAALIAATPSTSVRGRASESRRVPPEQPTAASPRVAASADTQTERAPAADATVVMTLPKWSASDGESS